MPLGILNQSCNKIIENKFTESGQYSSYCTVFFGGGVVIPILWCGQIGDPQQEVDTIDMEVKEIKNPLRFVYLLELVVEI
jgi:hypothetical protein